MTKTLFGSVASLSLIAASAQAQTADIPSPYVDEIIVTGSPIAVPADEVLVGVSVLTDDELERRIAKTIGETLKYEPGVSSTFFGAGASRPIIRGQGGDRVRVLTNGVGSIDASASSPDHAVAAEPAQAERIEVLRGASILRYGSSGAGGVVNVIDGRIPTALPEDGREVNLRMSATSVDSGIEAAGSIDQAIGSNLVLHLDGTFRDSGDFRIPGFAESAALRAEEEAEHAAEGEDHEEEEEEEVRDRLPNSFVESRSGTVGLSWIGDRGFFGAALHRFESDYGIPGGHEHGHEEEEGEEHDEEEHGEEDVTIDLEQTRFDVNAGLDLDGFFERLQFFGGYADYEHTEFEGTETGTVFANEGYEGRLELVQRQDGAWSAAHGVQIRSRDFSAIGEEAFVPPTKTMQYAGYTFHRYDTENWHLEGSGRIEFTDHDNSVTNQTRDFTALSVSAGADRHITETLKLGGTLFRTERAPTSEELFSNGPHIATNAFEIGDPSLGKEVATGGEIALRHRALGHAVTVNLFYTSYDDYIYERQTGAEEDDLPVFQFVGDDAEFYGVEAYGEVDLFSTGRWDVSVDALAEYVEAETDTGNLPRIPPLAILTGIEAQAEALRLRAELDWAADQDDTAAFERATDGYTLVNLFAAYDFGEAMTFSLGLDNVFDEEARQHTSFLKDDLPLPGRNLRFTVSAKL
ncbi:TonB-dependent receptor [uncultured Algimonas sp.]|uniref:TonB-dependent receptor n=1 Tax=uncultured Algimonas sp. TaxID=1547920 RepID=UPI00263300D3|nr:TonB-dependent receptor [uncultured Algimonas sp.]